MNQGAIIEICFLFFFLQNGYTALAIAKRFGYISVVNTLTTVTTVETTIVTSVSSSPLFCVCFLFFVFFFFGGGGGVFDKVFFYIKFS